MIENPHDLTVLRVALRMAISYTTNDLALTFYTETLEKVERLREDWQRRTARGPARSSKSAC